MTIVDLEAIAQRIRDADGDWEEAHMIEDTMMREVLVAIALDQTGDMSPKDLASKALSVLVEFVDNPHWFA